MTIEEMHYDFKKKFNKIDSEQNRNLMIPEIDWLLNEAEELFVKMVAEPRLRSALGFEINQRGIDDIRNLVTDTNCQAIPVELIGLIPVDYWHYISGYVLMTKGECSDIEGRLHIRQHDDEFEKSPFDSSSFEWRTVNGVFIESGIKLFTDGTFTIDQLCITYLKRPVYMHNAANFRAGEYRLPSGTLLTGLVNCELPEHTHREIVDIAVLIASGAIQASDYNSKLAKLNLNNLK